MAFSAWREDLQANQDTSTKSRIVVFLFRLAQWCAELPFGMAIAKYPSRVLYQLIAEWFLGVEIPWNTKIGPGLRLLHGIALVVNAEATIGRSCTLRHSTTIGNKILSDGTVSKSPQIGDNVDIGSNVTILGPVKVGNGAVIGAGAVVTKDVEPHTVVCGNPARLLRKLEPAACSEVEAAGERTPDSSRL